MTLKIEFLSIKEIDKETQKIIFNNLQINLDKINKLKEDLKNYKKENRSSK